MKTFRATEKDFNRKTYLIDASGKTLGRLSTKIASLLMGKGKTSYAPDQLSGDQVIVINAAKVHVTGNKSEAKIYTHYTGYAAGLRTTTFERLMAKKPETIITQAVKRMLPKTKLGREMQRRLRVFAGAEHVHSAQKPVTIEA